MSRAWFQSQGAFVTSKRAFKAATAREPRTAAVCCCWCNVSYNSTGFSFSFLSWEFSRLPVSISKALLILREAANICHFSRHFFVGLFVACFINCVVNYLNYIFQEDRSHLQPFLKTNFLWNTSFRLDDAFSKSQKYVYSCDGKRSCIHSK